MAGVIERNNVHVRGAGDRTIVFAHGFGCDFKQRRDAGRTIVADWQLAERSRMPNPLANKKLRPKRIGPSMLPEKPRRAGGGRTGPRTSNTSYAAWYARDSRRAVVRGRSQSGRPSENRERQLSTH